MIAPPEDHEILREACDGGSGHLTLEADPNGMICAIERPDEDATASIIVAEPQTARRIARHLVAWADKQGGADCILDAQTSRLSAIRKALYERAQPEDILAILDNEA